MKKALTGWQIKTKRSIFALITAGLGLTVLGVVLAVGAFILSQIQAQFTAATNEYNVTVEGLQALVTTSTFLSVLGISLIAGQVIRVLIGSFLTSGGRGGEV